MKKPSVLPYVLALLRNAAILEILILIVVFAIGHFAKWSSYNTYGNFMFLIGILVLVVAGFGVGGGVRQGLWASPQFLTLQKIVTQEDIDNAANGVTGFFQTYAFSLCVGSAALIAILLGILITTLYPA